VFFPSYREAESLLRKNMEAIDYIDILVRKVRDGGGDKKRGSSPLVELIHQRRQHDEQLKYLFVENQELRAVMRRESEFRANLAYQKRYLLLLVEDLESR